MNDLALARMMNQSIQNLPPEAARQLAQQKVQMELTAEIFKLVMNGVSENHEYAAFKAMSTMSTVTLLEQVLASRGFSPQEAAAWQQRNQQYLQTIDAVLQSANYRLVQTMNNVPPADTRGFFKKLADAINGQ